ncbi:hypothetical protein K504DRAFT_92493 [Pleomassaria siparia CBS 279.74]|uniref:Mid2 domain-containing protein n=1 Tax=Pleomassaria siparia CBS 279.74 TaxID=1314801 RepID=A0A6G1JYJ0_9PLEO|nr:hypothetical protein K504DRAFT_92493 [Pleomassaria siparia CBS 279.74]
MRTPIFNMCQSMMLRMLCIMYTLFHFALFANTVTALLLFPEPTNTDLALHNRDFTIIDTTTTTTTRTWGYYSYAETSGTTIWQPTVYHDFEDDPVNNDELYTTSGSFFKFCYCDYYETLGLYLPPSSTSTSCLYWTSCSMGTLYGDSTSTMRSDSRSVCYTDIYYSSWGASNPLTSFLLFYDTPLKITSYFKEQPPDIVPSSTTISNTAFTTSSNTALSSSSVSTSPAHTPTPTTTTTPTSTPNQSSSSNAKVIAGSVVGGLAGLILAMVAVLLILRHYKHRNASTVPALNQQVQELEGAPISRPDPNLPEWVSHTPTRSVK